MLCVVVDWWRECDSYGQASLSAKVIDPNTSTSHITHHPSLTTAVVDQSSFSNSLVSSKGADWHEGKKKTTDILNLILRVG